MQKQEIILKFYRDHKSYSEIAKELAIDWRTVKKYISQYRRAEKALQSESDAINSIKVMELQCEIVQAPRYIQKKPRSKRRLSAEIQKEIDRYLLENEQRRKKGFHKQLLKKQDIYGLLKSQGQDIGYTTVCNYIREQEEKHREAFIKQVYAPGSVCEFDWGEVKLKIGGIEKKYHLSVFTSAYSNYRYSKLYQRQDGYCMSDAHASFFEHVGGSYGQMVYDNTRTVIRKFIARNEKQPTELLLQLSTYYRFGYRFCNAYRGNEKGHVERSVEYIRRKAFAYQYCFNTLEEAQVYLEKIVSQLNHQSDAEGKSAEVLFEQERANLQRVGPRFEHFVYQDLRVDKYSTICYQTNHYSVPDHLVGKLVQVKIYPHQLSCHYQNQLVSSHPHQYSRASWYIRLEDYLPTLQRKPGALSGSLAIKQTSDEIKQLYNCYFKEHPRDFVEMMLYIKEKQIDIKEMKETIEKIQHNNLGENSFAKIRCLLEQKADGVVESPSQKGDIEIASKELLNQLAQLQKMTFNEFI